MSNQPAITAKDFVRVVTTRLDYTFRRQKGSHAVYKNPGGRRVVVPMHPGITLKHGTLNGMLDDIGMTREEFFRLL